METMVESFATTEPETGEHAPESEAEALEIIERLELEGQRTRVTVDADGNEKRNPFPEMTAEQKGVYETIFGEQTPISEFDAETIPLRVLKLVETAEPHFDEFTVWHQATEVKDPLVVALDDDGNEHLIARWGSALRPFEELRDLAVKRTVEELSDGAREKIAECEALLESVESKARKLIAGEIRSWTLPI